MSKADKQKINGYDSERHRTDRRGKVQCFSGASQSLGNYMYIPFVVLPVVCYICVFQHYRILEKISGFY